MHVVPSTISAEELLAQSHIPIEVVDTDIDLYHHMARTMFDTLRANNAANRPTVFIVPVGPVGQYRRFAELCNRYRESCCDLFFFNMDEYLDEHSRYVPTDHPLSFRGFMEREYRQQLDEGIRPAMENVYFPDPEAPEQAAKRIEQLGGVEICFGGIGINGHIAFNEPPEPGVTMSDEEFADLPTRVLPLSRESITINAFGGASGDIRSLPPLAVTLGMRELLASRKMRFYCNRPWQKSIVRRIALTPPTAAMPATFMQRHPDARLTISSEVAQIPVVRLG